MIKIGKRLRNLLGTTNEIPVKNHMPPIIIVGCMRSGTSFLADKLSCHPQLLKVGNELSEAWERLTDAEISSRCTAQLSDDYLPIHTYRFARYIQEFIDESRLLKRRLMRINIKLSRGLGRVNYDWDNVIPLLKSTHLMNKIPFVNRVFPDAKFILIQRSIYAQSASLKMHFLNQIKKGNYYGMPKDESACWSTLTSPKEQGQLGVFPNNFSIIPKMWKRLNDLAIRDLKNLDSSKVLIVSYEDLVNNQADTFEEIFKFLDLDQRYRKEESEVSVTKSKVFNTTTSGSVLDKWKDHLSDEEVQIVNEVENSKC